MKREHRPQRCGILQAAVLTLLLACGAGVRAQEPATEPIRIASINALTGIAAPIARHSIAGIRCAVGEINRRGGVLGRPLALIEIDNRSTPIGSKVAADQAVAAGVAAIVGSAWSSHTIAAARVAQASGVPMINSIATAPEVTRIGDFIFRVCFNDLFQGRILAEFARRNLALSSAVMFVNITSDYSMGLATEFQRNFERQGGKVLAQMNYKPDQADFRDALERTAGLKPEILFIPGYDESGVIIAAAAVAGLAAIPIGGDGWGVDTLERGGRATRLGYYCAHWAQELDSPAARNFIKVYRMFDPEGKPSGESALAYDAVMLLADAISRAGAIERFKIRNAIAATHRFEGATGNISFEENRGDPVKSAVIIKIENGMANFLNVFSP